MRLLEFASAEEQLALWKLVSDNVWKAIAQQAREEAAEKAERARQAKLRAKSKPKAVAPLSDPIPGSADAGSGVLRISQSTDGGLTRKRS